MRIWFLKIQIFSQHSKKKFHEDISLKDKAILYQFYNDKQENINLFKKFLDDFTTVIIFINNNLSSEKEGKLSLDKSLSEKSKLSDAFKYLTDTISEDFVNFFKDNDNYTINKLKKVYEFYLLLIFKKIILKEIKEFQIKGEKLDKEKIFETLNENQNNEKDTFKDDFTIALRLFISIFLLKEKDKENKIKNNCNNIASYLNVPDLWDQFFYDNKKKFKNSLNIIKGLNIPLNMIISLYELMDEDIDKKYLEEVREEIERQKEIKKQRQEEITKQKNLDNMGPPKASIENIKANENSEKEEENEKDEDEFDEDKYFNHNNSEDDDDDEEELDD